MPLTESDAERLKRLDALLPRLAAECLAKAEHIGRVIEESDRRMAPYRPLLRRIRARLERAGYYV
jgi:hypothetical protein